MKTPKFLRPAGGRNALRGGAYSIVVTGVVLAILVLVNILAAALPASLTKHDISAAQLYSITSNTKVVVNALEEDVTIYWIVQSGEEDDVIENLLGKYESLSGHIQVVKKNPDVYPTFAQQYTDETVYNNSLVVECGDKSRFIGYYDIYLQEEDMYSYYYGTASFTSFDGEGAITSAIDYVVSEDQPQLYLLEGHGESELPAAFSEQLEKENIQVNTLSLLTVDAVPEEADCVMIYAPATDISQDEADMLSDYAAGGGKLLVMAGPSQEDDLDTLHSLLSQYGITAAEGIVVETDRGYYVQQPYALLPDLNSHSITDPLLEENYLVVMPISTGLDLSGVSGDDTVTALLTTTDGAFSKAAGYDLDTYEQEEGDIDGPFALAVSIDAGSGGQIVWFSSSAFLEDVYNALSSGANVNLAMNSLSALIGESEAMAIRSKSLNYNYLTIDSATSSLLQVIMIGVFPLLYLGIGICVVVKRRNMQNVPV